LANLLGTPSITPAAKKSDAAKAKTDNATSEPVKPLEKTKEPSRLRSSWDAVTSFFGIQPSETDSPIQSAESERIDVRQVNNSEPGLRDSGKASHKREKSSLWDTNDSTMSKSSQPIASDDPPFENRQDMPADEPDVSFGSPRRKAADRTSSDEQQRGGHRQPRGDRQSRGAGERPPRQERPLRDGERPLRDGERPLRDGERPLRDGERPQRGSGGREQRSELVSREERASRGFEKTTDSRSDDPDSLPLEPRPSQNRHKDRPETDRQSSGEASPERRSHRRPPRRGRVEGEMVEPTRDRVDSIEPIDLGSPSEDSDSTRRSTRDRIRKERDSSRSSSPPRNRSDTRSQEDRPTEGIRTRPSEDARSSETRNEARGARSSGRDLRDDSRDSSQSKASHSSASHTSDLRGEGRRSEASDSGRDSRHRSSDGNRNTEKPARNERVRGPRVERTSQERMPAADGFGEGIDDTVGFVPLDDEDYVPSTRSSSARSDDESEIRQAGRKPKGERIRSDRQKRQVSEEDDRRGGDEDREAVSAVTNNGKIPSWAEALEGIVSANTENHQRNAGGGGRGRGRGPRH